MRRKTRTVLWSLLVALTFLLAGGFLTQSISAQADTVPIIGLTGSDAKVTDLDGSPIAGGQVTNGQSYDVSYTWGIRDGIPVRSGDTAVVSLPSGMYAANDMVISVVDDVGREVGIFTIKAGETSGIITFSDLLGTIATNRAGTLTFMVKAGESSGNNAQSNKIAKQGIILESDAQGRPTKLRWTIYAAQAGKDANDAVLTDTMGPGQTYIEGSATAERGQVMPTGVFVGSSNVTPSVAVSGSQLTITIPGVTNAARVTYDTTPTNFDQNGWENAVSFNGQKSDSNIAWGGSATGGGTQPNTATGSVVLTKTDPEGKVLAGAVYTLKKTDGTVVATGLKTDEQGKITYEKLEPGAYEFIETVAPSGYQVSEKPVTFTIVANQTATVSVTAQDDPLKENPGTTTPTEPENPTEPGNPGTTTPTEPTEPGTPTNPTEPSNPGTTPPTKPENPGTTVPPTKPGVTPPTKPGVTPPVKPTKPIKPTVPPTMPKHPTTPGTPITTKPGHPSTPVATVKSKVAPSSRVTPKHVVTATTNGSVSTGTGAPTGTMSTGMTSSSTGTEHRMGHSNGAVYASGHSLPQTGEQRTTSQGLQVVGGVLLILVSIGGYGWYELKRRD
ncbi:membrane protein [Levilactobacillus brevis]|uniref:SpaA isopeptide-forming pilin-related protein n=1 Tax=Levilactobacillus brevis TaxID=1580 RepID=UPI0005B6230F|nr:SpaA isopeptide-forming pilin-related protein [Levilactobacillus brevis]KIR08932.1 membrane protein [Levilactobacillus brevis]